MQIKNIKLLDPQLANHDVYDVLGYVGAGTFGSVLHARNKQTGEEVAIKLIALGQNFYQKYVYREIMNHHKFAHPHVVAFIEVFLTPRHLCIVMEYVGGGNLQQCVERNGVLPEWQARCFFQQITLALHYIHKSLGIAHRDIKLGNILLNDRYQIPILKICDFGYSKSMQAASMPKTRVGTAAYISPEVAKCSGTAAYDTEKADVWSSGVTLFCMIAGRYPFTGPRGKEVPLQRIKDLTVSDVKTALSMVSPTVSDSCVDLLSAMLTIDPVKRISLDGIMQHEWFRQFLPDISKLVVRAKRTTQSESDVAEVLAEAERRSEAVRQGEYIDDKFDDDLDYEIDQIIDVEEEKTLLGEGIM